MTMRAGWRTQCICGFLLAALSSANSQSPQQTTPGPEANSLVQGSRYPTAVHPAPAEVIRRDHKAADAESYRLRQQEVERFAREHSRLLTAYVEGRLADAEYRARSEFLRQEHENRRREIAARPSSGGQSGSSSSSVRSGIIDSWLPPANPGSGKPSKGLTDTARKVAEEVPRRTREILRGNDDLVRGNESYGLPRGIAVFLALLMLHIPSVALASLVTGVVLIRGQRTKAGGLFLGLAAILGVVIFSLLPW